MTKFRPRFCVVDIYVKSRNNMGNIRPMFCTVEISKMNNNKKKKNCGFHEDK